MKTSEIVMVYSDPQTKQHPEGRAKLLRKLYDVPGMNGEQWEVHFEVDPAGSTYPRLICE